MIDRRHLIQLMSAAALSSCGSKSPNASHMKVLVVGAGIVGASIAYHLAKRGVAVTVIDKIGPAAQASRGTFAWINATWAKQPKEYHALNQTGVSSWAKLQAEFGIPIKWGGSLEWFDTAKRQAKLKAQIAEQVEWGEPAAMLPVSKLVQLEPHVDFSGVSSAAFSENDGAVDPVAATLALLKAAKANGAIVKYPCELLSISDSKDGIKYAKTNLGDIAADKIILATGAAEDVTDRFANLSLPQRPTPGVIAITKPMPTLLNRIIVAPGVHMHQRIDGRIVLGEQDGAPDTEAHAMRLKGRPVKFPSTEFAEQHFMRILGVAEHFVPDIASAEAEAVHIGWRPLPLDGHPALGFSPRQNDVYIAIMHSGVSLAPIVGQLVAHEVITDTKIEQLANYRPGRIFENVKRY